MQTLSGLNDSQWKAVCHTGAHLLIVAGPGTGKTHTITRRIAHMIPSLKPNQKVLAITFTNKAAQEMQGRLLALGVPLNKALVGTFHAFCLKLLRDHWQETALPKDFKVAIPQDIQGFDKAVLERIGLMKSTRLVIEGDNEYKTYQRYLRKNNWIDFDDILREALALLENEDIAHQVRACYRHIFVDEYQDTNIIQNALLKILTQEGTLLTAIGDPNQSIYGFRGGNVALFGRFKDDFPGVRELTLQENYRSASNLLAASCQVMGGLELLAKLDAKGKLVTHEAASDAAEADYVTSQIEKMVGGMDMLSARGAYRSLGDIAILYRLNAERHVIGQALEHLGIPYQVSQKVPKPAGYSDEAVLGQFEEELDYNVEKVSLLTLHAAKGLEFPVVFIIGCEAKLLPLDIHAMKGDPQEERRLFYVGMTRAREHLYLTRARRRQLFGQTWFNPPSPFLADIEEDLKVYENSKPRRGPRKSEEAEKQQLKLF
ncbi:MAG: ATP-dependent helicase [Candidatus Omnitrophica bacterium]|nr:ATP-dependent helicase [Candidatus Omnitrophota bacterium]